MGSDRVVLGISLGVALALAAAPARGETITYTYDEFGQLKSASSTSGVGVTYTYDAAGNRTQLTSTANQAPDAVNDSISVTTSTPHTFDPRTNDIDPENDPLTITAKTNGSNGTVAINSGASLTYTPTTGYTGSDSFTYTISDGQGGQDTATVSVTVSNSIADGTVLYTSSTSGSFSYTVPAGVNYVDIEGWGGGANGAYFPAVSMYFGGGGGGYFKKHIAVTQGQVIAGNIAAGGGTASTAVSAPALTATTPLPLNGQSGGQGGMGGTASGGDVNTSGATCCQTVAIEGGSAGNGGGNQSTQNANGTSPGGGGAGNTGLGANGRITITARTS